MWLKWGPRNPVSLSSLPLVVSESRDCLKQFKTHGSRLKAVFLEHTAGLWALHLFSCCSLCLKQAHPLSHSHFCLSKSPSGCYTASWSASELTFCSSKPFCLISSWSTIYGLPHAYAFSIFDPTGTTPTHLTSGIHFQKYPARGLA